MKVIFITLILLLHACKTKEHATKTEASNAYIPDFNAAGPPILVYNAPIPLNSTPLSLAFQISRVMSENLDQQ